MSIVYSLFVGNTLFHEKSIGSGQAFKVLFQHLSKNSGPLDSKLDIRTIIINYTTKQKKEYQEVGVQCILRLGHSSVLSFDTLCKEIRS